MSSLQSQMRRVEALRKKLKPAPPPEGRMPGIEYLSDGELAKMEHWAELEEALGRHDTAVTERLRRRQNTTLEQLVDRFLNLDLSSLPTDRNVPGVQIQEGNCFYSMACTNYQYIQMMIKRNNADKYKEDMWRWVEFIEDGIKHE